VFASYVMEIESNCACEVMDPNERGPVCADTRTLENTSSESIKIERRRFGLAVMEKQLSTQQF